MRLRRADDPQRRSIFPARAGEAIERLFADV
jgi:hypothetical protein